MKTRIRTSEDQLVVCRDKAGVILYVIFLAICCITFGMTFSYVGKADLFSLCFGIAFIVAGGLIILALPKYHKTMVDEGGAVLLSANREGLSIAPLLNMTPVKYPWADISRIFLAKKLITKETGERGYSWNQAIVFFRRGGANDNMNILQRSRSQVWKSPKGHNISTVDVPKEGINQVKEALIRLSSGKSEISIVSSILFDYVNDSERLEP